MKYASASEQLNAAEAVAQSLRERGHKIEERTVDPEDHLHKVDAPPSDQLTHRISRVIAAFFKD